MSISYRPEIDGLRTISVLLVIFHHLGWSFFPGGYIGVDVFFIISGFLITKIITTEIRAGYFSIGQFYKRRIIRLAPALLTMLVVTSLVSLIVMLPAELINYFNSVIYSSFFAANFYMWKEAGGYFGAQTEFIPLLHLWSLAVEEQFYIFWPIILLLVLKFIPSRLLLLIISLMLLFSIAVSEWGVQNYSAAAYYLMPTRAFELLMGAFIVFLPNKKYSRSIRNIMSILGLSLIFFSALNYSTDTIFPGIKAILPCLGASLILIFCNKDDIVGKILSRKAMTFIGKISYPAYLWHWPIIVFLNIYTININLTISIGVILLTFLLSALTHYLIERPAKNLNKYNIKKIVVYVFLLPTISLITFSSYARTEEGWPQRFPLSLNIKNEAILSYSHKIRDQCIDTPIYESLPNENQCILGKPDKLVDFLLIGDSHANHFTGMIDVIAAQAGLRGHEITQSNTIYLPDTKSFYILDSNRIEYTNFSIKNKQITNLVNQKKYKAVVLAGSFANHLNDGDFESELSTQSEIAFKNQFKKAINQIENTGASVFLIKGNPVLKDVSYDCTLINERFNKNENCNLPIKIHREHFKKWDNFLDELQSEFPNLTVIDPASIICNSKECLTEINGIPLYRDNNHLNYIGSELVGRLYLEKFGNPLSVIREK